MESPTIFSANGLPKVFDRRKHRQAPSTVENQESTLPQTGPKTNELVMVTTLAGRGAMMACPTINPTEMTTAQGP